MGLKEQNVIIKFLLEINKSKEINRWQSLVTRFPITIQNFCRRYLIASVANGSNLRKWKISENGSCHQLQTQLHVFNNCKEALNRYEWRHNSILKSLCNHLSKKVSCYLQLFSDIDGFENPSTLFKSR